MEAVVGTTEAFQMLQGQVLGVAVGFGKLDTDVEADVLDVTAVVDANVCENVLTMLVVEVNAVEVEEVEDKLA